MMMNKSTPTVGFLAALSHARADLLEQYLGLSLVAISSRLPGEAWTPKDILVHTMAWDQWCLSQMQAMLRGDTPDLSAEENESAFNAGAIAAWQGQSLEQVLAALVQARAAWETWLMSLPESVFLQARPGASGDWSFPDWLRTQSEHELAHAEQLRQWKRQLTLEPVAGPPVLFKAALYAAHAELLRAANALPLEMREGEALCGVWDAKDILGHVADWDLALVGAVRAVMQGASAMPYFTGDLDALNESMVAAHKAQSWDMLCSLLQISQGKLRALVDDVPAAAWDAVIPVLPEDPQETLHALLLHHLLHAREHAAELRAGLKTDDKP